MQNTVLIHPDELTEKWIDRMADAGVETLGIHPRGGKYAEEACYDLLERLKTPEFRSLLDYAASRRLKISYEIHAAMYLLPRELFDTHPEYFRVDKEGVRTPKRNFCVSSPEALEIVVSRAQELAAQLYRSDNRYFIWLDDGHNLHCHCPKCRGLSPSDQQLLVMNAIVRRLRKKDPYARLAYLAYYDCLALPERVKPEQGIFLEYAPLEKYSAKTEEAPQRIAKEFDMIDPLLDFFGREDATVLEYWYDNSMYSGWKKPPKPFTLNEEAFRKDVPFYLRKGFRRFSTFACYLGPDYEALWGEPDIHLFAEVLKESGRAYWKAQRETLPPVMEAELPIERLTPEGEQYFFGYYDLRALDAADRRQLYHKTAFMDRLPAPGDRAELGWLDPETKQLHPFAETNAWNFQQGSLLQWTPFLGADTLIYNDYDAERGYFCALSDASGKTLKTYPRPIAAISPDNRYAVSINFLRVYDFRPGYGYCQIPDPNRDVPQPEDDGVWLIDTQTGETKQILNYPQLGRLLGVSQDTKLLVNHISFNTTSDRLVMLVRDFGAPGEHWKTAVVTMDRNGACYVLRPLYYGSHYHWRDRDTLMIFSDVGEGRALLALKDRTQEYSVYGKDLFTKDIHCSYSPDRTFILGDGYPDADRYRPLYLYHIPSGRHLLLGRFYAPPLTPKDIRCDLHARWSNDGSFITFDSVHEGFRAIYRMNVAPALERLKNENANETTKKSEGSL